MGNTLTKESGSDTDSRSGTIPSNHHLHLNSHSHHGDEPPPPPTRSSRHRQRHTKSKHSAKREGYEMIIDPNESVDGGYLFPQDVYQGAQDYKVSIVREMIIRRKLAPFYKGMDSIDPNWSDDELYEQVKGPEPTSPPKPGQPGPPTQTECVWLYRNAHECPICFLVYPRLNDTRCCGQEICTECFVQIKRNPPHPPYTSNDEATDVLELLSEPAACPYCAQPDLGVIFEASPFEWGIPSSAVRGSTESVHLTVRGKRQILPPTHESVVTVDMIRPDWEDKLASARRRLARKSASARALHQSALLPNTVNDVSRPRLRSMRTSDEGLNCLVRATRSMSIQETQLLEQRMLEEAIKASLSQM